MKSLIDAVNRRTGEGELAQTFRPRSHRAADEGSSRPARKKNPGSAPSTFGSYYCFFGGHNWSRRTPGWERALPRFAEKGGLPDELRAARGPRRTTSNWPNGNWLGISLPSHRPTFSAPRCEAGHAAGGIYPHARTAAWDGRFSNITAEKLRIADAADNLERRPTSMRVRERNGSGQGRRSPSPSIRAGGFCKNPPNPKTPATATGTLGRASQMARGYYSARPPSWDRRVQKNQGNNSVS